jgi:hypothetical protein
MVAATGAKNGRRCPMTSVATIHASVAASAVWAMGSALEASRAHRARSDARERRAASSTRSSPRAARLRADRSVGQH